MIRKKLMGLSFTLGNSSRRLINIRLRFVSQLSASEKDDDLSPNARILSELKHRKFMNLLNDLVNQPEIDPDLCVKFLRRVEFYEAQRGYLEKLQRDFRFKLLCDNLTDICESIPQKEATYILIQLCKLGIHNIYPLTVIRYWNRHIANLRNISCVEIENLLVEVLGRSTNIAWIERKKFLLACRLKTKFSFEKLENYSTTSIISAFNLMKTFGIVDLKTSDKLLKSLANKFPPNWLKIFFILTHFDDLPEHESLLQEARKHIFEDIFLIRSVYPLSNLITLLESISKKVFYGHLEFYDPKVVDVIVDEALRQECRFEEGKVILKHISSMYHQHIPLLDYLIRKYEDDKHPKQLFQLVNLFSYAVKVNCETTARLLLEKVMCQEESIKASPKTLINVVYYMSVLDYCDQGLLETLFTHIMSNIQNYKIQRLISWLKIFRPSVPLPKLVDMAFENIEGEKVERTQLDISETTSKKFEKKKVKVFPLKSKLEILFGGPEYLLTNVKVRFRLSVDHAIIFREGGYPVAVNANTKTNYNNISLNRLSIPPNSHIVIFQYIPPRGYVLNTGEINGPYKLYIKCLKELKYNTIFVDQFEWNNMPDSERTPWLMRIVREECNHIFKNEAYFV